VKPALRAVRSAARRLAHAALNPIDPPILVLVYHRIAALADDPLGLAVRPARFRDQLRTLAAASAVVRFERLGERPAGPAVAVTFDDGYADNLTEALPILEETGIPACFFVASGYVGGAREFWWDELDRLIPERDALPASIALSGRTSEPVPTRTAAERSALKAQIRERLRRLPATSREALLDEIGAWSGRGRGVREAYRALTVAELARLAASPLATIGAHSVTHSSFAALDAEARRAELRDSKAALEAWTSRPVTAFAYPFGERSDVPREGAREASEAGFTVVALNQPGQVRRATDLLRVPRFVVRDWEVPEFERRLRGFRTA